MTRRADSDEAYILGLCDRLLGAASLRQHTFDFLRGDPDSRGRTRRLPVDAYYPDLALVIEYRELQQATYGARRRQVLPAHGLSLIELDAASFARKRRRLARDVETDLIVLRWNLQFVSRIGGPGVPEPPPPSPQSAPLGLPHKSAILTPSPSRHGTREGASIRVETR